MKLMIVDDHAGVRRMIRDLLAAPGDPLQECASADEALRLSADFKPDCVTMDVRMPGQCAFAVTRAIRAAHPGVHIIIVSSHQDAGLCQSATTAGADAYVVKDRLSELPGVVSRIMREGLHEPKPAGQKFNSMKRLLLVDDDEMTRTMLGVMFSDAGYQVHHAANGNEALRIHQEKPVHVIVTEMLLPEMDGIELLMALRRQPAAPKVIAMTAGGHFAVEHCLRVAKQLGAHHVLAKPFQAEQLLAVVRSVLGENLS